MRPATANVLDQQVFLPLSVLVLLLTLAISLRRATAALMPLLPGVRAHPERPEVLMVDTRVARWFPLEIFHLLGYRKLRRNGEGLFVSRRRYDLSAPREISLATDRCGQPT